MIQPRVRGLFGLLLLAATSCAGGWHQLKTRRITGYTDRPLAFRETMRQLEYSYAALATFFPRAQVGPVEVLFMDGTHQAHSFGMQRGGLVFASVPGARRLGRQKLLVMGPESSSRVGTKLLSHLFLHAVAPRAPLWLHQGLAMYLTSAALQEGGGRWRACFGYQATFSRMQMPLEKFLAVSWQEFGPVQSLHLGTGWLLVDFVFHGDGGAHLTKVPAIIAAAGQGVAGAQILADTFPGMTLPQLDERISAFQGAQRERGVLCPLPLPIPADKIPDESDLQQSPVAAEEIAHLLAALEKVPRGDYLPSWYPPEILAAPGPPVSAAAR